MILAAVALIAAMMQVPARADDVVILATEFRSTGEGLWLVHVTLRHGDTGWEHYGDAWRVVDGDGNVLGERVLHHPHVEEQPFTRSLGNLRIPAGTPVVYIEAHDSVHGWSPQRLPVDLTRAQNGSLRVEAPPH